MVARLLTSWRDDARAAWRAHWRWVVVVAVVLVAVCLPNYPGRWNTDTGVMIEQMQAGRYDDVWSPFITWLWKPFFDMGIGAGWVMALQVVVIALSIGVILRRLGVSGHWAPWLTTALCVSPVLYASAISVMRDTWFLCALLVALGCLLSPRSRRTVALFAVAVVLGIASRQNGAAAMAVVSAWAVWRWGPIAPPTRRVLAAGAAGMLVTLAVIVSLAAWEVVADVDQEHPETAVFVGDLDEMSGRVGRMLLPESIVDPPFTMAELETSSIYNLDTLWFFGRRASLRQPDDVHAEIATAWRAAVREHPVVYLQGRWKLFTRQIGWSGPPSIAYFPADIGTSRSPSPAFPDAASGASTYLSWFSQDGSWQSGGWVHRAWWWWAAIWAVAVVQWRSSRRRAYAAFATVVSAHLMALFVVAPHVQFRFVEGGIEVVQVALVAALAATWNERRPRAGSKRSVVV